ncbi:MAG: hypothetical protein J1F23_08835 [Oscillospiraceae bacterium]|nr:hypothetical protein [Oscillospiraceae bacterium]
MTLSELGEQYKKDLKTLEGQIKRLKRELKNTTSETKKSNLLYKIYIYEDMYRETASLAAHLNHYYEER